MFMEDKIDSVHVVKHDSLKCVVTVDPVLFRVWNFFGKRSYKAGVERWWMRDG
jgi:hypothetical protein